MRLEREKPIKKQVNAIEKLCQSVEQTALEVCF